MKRILTVEKKIFLVCSLPLLGLLEAVTTSSEVTDLPWDWPLPPTGDWNGLWFYLFLHRKEPILKIRNKYSQKRNCAPRGHSPNFHMNVSVGDLYIPPLICLTCCRKICGPILGIHKSLTDTWVWKLGLRPLNSQKGMGFSLQCRASGKLLPQ